MGNQDVTGDHGHQGRQDRAGVGNDNGNAQHTGGVGAHLSDGWSDEADDNQGYAEHDQLVQDILQRDHNGHHALRQDEAQDDAYDDAQQQPRRQAFEDFHADSS